MGTSKKTAEVCEEICAKVADRGNLDAILLEDRVRYPCQSTWNDWIVADPELASRYYTAQRAYAASLVYEAKDIVDGKDDRAYEDGEYGKVYNHHKASLMQKQRFFMAERLDKITWAQTQKLEHTGKDGAPIQTAHTLSDEDLMKIAMATKGAK